MEQTQQIYDGIYWIGGNDFVTPRFENIFPLPFGVTYNSYFIDDEKTAVVDSVDAAIRDLFMENVEYLLKGRSLDYIIINHMEPDHCESLLQLADMYPDAKIAGSPAALRFFEQYYHHPLPERYVKLSERAPISLGKRTLRFVNAPMVHWPEVTVTYDETDKILFSADAFGTFGVIHGSIFADWCDYKERYLDEARRYYGNIVGKFGRQVLALYRKLEKLDIDMIAPLHGPVFRRKEDVSFILTKVKEWASWTPEREGAAILFASAYGRTAEAAQIAAAKLAEEGVRDIKLVDLCATDVSFAVADVFAYSHIVLAAPTYNAGLYPVMDHFLSEMTALMPENRKIAIIGNATWIPQAASKVMEGYVEKWKNSPLITAPAEVTSAVGDKERESIRLLAEAVAKNILTAEE